MIYVFEIETAASPAYTADVPLETRLPLHPGIIHQIDLQFPKMFPATLRLKIFQGITQIWPSNPTGNFRTLDETISFRESFYLFDTPYELIAKTWNKNTAYPLNLRLRFGILQPWQLGLTMPILSPHIDITEIEEQLNQDITT